MLFQIKCAATYLFAVLDDYFHDKGERQSVLEELFTSGQHRATRRFHDF